MIFFCSLPCYLHLPTSTGASEWLSLPMKTYQVKALCLPPRLLLYFFFFHFDSTLPIFTLQVEEPELGHVGKRHRERRQAASAASFITEGSSKVRCSQFFCVDSYGTNGPPSRFSVLM